MSYTSYFYLLFFSGCTGDFVLPDAPEKVVARFAGRQLFLLLAGLRKADCFPADHDGVGLSGGSCYGAGAESL